MASSAVRMPFWSRWNSYQAERFPLASHTVAIALLFGSTWFAAQALTSTGRLQIGPRGLAAFAATFLTLLLLRVFDEFKDFDDDRINHPDRVVQRGVVTLGELRGLGWIVVAVLATLAAILGVGPAIAFGAVFGFALLMRVEFFVRDWLRGHVFTYALTHQGITPLICLYIGTVSLGSWTALPRGFLAVLGAATGVGLCFELSRKFLAPEDEKPTLDTYTRRFGPRGASWVGFATLVVAAGCSAWLVHTLALPGWVGGLIGLATIVGAAGYARYAASPTARNARGVKDLGTLAVVLLELFLVVGMVAARGVTWGN